MQMSNLISEENKLQKHAAESLVSYKVFLAIWMRNSEGFTGGFEYKLPASCVELILLHSHLYLHMKP